jgi:ribonuclease P protein component
MRIRQQGHRLALGCLIANWSKLPDGSAPKLGVVTSKKIGNEPARSRARRLLRESFRLHQHEFAQPVELVLSRAIPSPAAALPRWKRIFSPR